MNPAKVNASPMTIRRMKTYTGGQGYVYQYYFVGQRPAVESGPPAIEYVFDVTSDRKKTYAVSVLVDKSALEGWSRDHGRSPTDAEQYAAAKMRLFKAFDDVENMMADGRILQVDRPSLDEAFSNLGVE